jgi:hypothetical protein
MDQTPAQHADENSKEEKGKGRNAGTRDRQPVFRRHPGSQFPSGTAQEAADRIRLRAGRPPQFLQRDAALPFPEVEDLGRFAAVAGGAASSQEGPARVGLALAGATGPRRLATRAIVAVFAGAVFVRQEAKTPNFSQP